MKNNHAKSFVTIMIVLALSSLVLRYAIESFIRMNMVQNESNAQATLKLISAALENYAQDNRGVYPANFSFLTRIKPPNIAPYLDKDYVTPLSLKGYLFACSRLEPTGYSCSAIPTKCKLTASKTYSITTGSPLIEEECDKKERE